MEEIKKIEKEKLYLLSMNVILHAGNAKEFIFQAIHKAQEGDFESCNLLMQEANSEIVLAHKLQTETLQKEAEGLDFPYSPLFVHAQDTLMTTKSEIDLMKEIIQIYKELRK
ncbi:MAG TPA: PTS lactose/cellobiose transporter subunit IIA [Lactovum miscens]|uniref:PTS lactose/cellobiose transporter subunit IIA n=1 Tax=Lactovum miscens TaxID=190387 RepID=UPI002EDAC3D4